eukprot:Colp12_sorted_trinity150504_noHs@21149
MSLGSNKMPVMNWVVRLSDGDHKVSIEHDTMSGRRVITVDGTEVIRHNWMFKLTGVEKFMLKNHKMAIEIDADNFSYIYTLSVDGKTLNSFSEQRQKIVNRWVADINGAQHTVAF